MKKRMNTRAKWIILTCVVVLLLLNTSIHLGFLTDQGGVHIAFDKLPMMLADKIVVINGEKEYTITDKDIVREVARQCVTPTFAKDDHGFNHNSELYLVVYCGNTRIRRMQFDSSGYKIAVYHVDAFHWCLGGAEKGKGYTSLSRPLALQIMQIIGISD